MKNVVGASPVTTRNVVRPKSGFPTFVCCAADILLSGLFQDVEGVRHCPICDTSIQLCIEREKIKVAWQLRSSALTAGAVPQNAEKVSRQQNALIVCWMNAVAGLCFILISFLHWYDSLKLRNVFPTKHLMHHLLVRGCRGCNLHI
jgi:hypothetical protein